MPNTRLLLATALAVMTAFTFPAAASAGPLQPIGFLVGEYENHTFQPLSQDKSSFLLAAYNIQGSENQQSVTGNLGGAPFVGFLAAHEYDRATDHVTWTLSGSADPSGATPPQPVALTFEVMYDRIREANTVSVRGSVAGQQVVGEAFAIDIPTPYQLLG